MLLGRLRRIFIKALAILAALTVKLVNEFVHQFHMARIDSLLAKISQCCLEDLLRKIDCRFIVERKRTNRHTGHTGGIFDHCSRHTLNKHVVGFRHITQHATIDVETACVVDDNRRLLDCADIIERYS